MSSSGPDRLIGEPPVHNVAAAPELDLIALVIVELPTGNASGDNRSHFVFIAQISHHTIRFQDGYIIRSCEMVTGEIECVARTTQTILTTSQKPAAQAAYPERADKPHPMGVTPMPATGITTVL